ncbi:MAG: type II toxin-antitoxin system VapB family antitoxin [Desulfobacula sp.]|nr:type II toxin-antitoxin system VapB family antitoxin [Desulfobacula sp.]
MATNLAIDDNFIEKARLLGKHKTKKAVVNDALTNQMKVIVDTCIWSLSFRRSKRGDPYDASGY